MELAIEAKASSRITSDHLKGLRSLSEDFPKIKKKIVVCLEPKTRVTSDKIVIMPYRVFAEKLWAKSLV